VGARPSDRTSTAGQGGDAAADLELVPFPVPETETARLAALYELEILDTPCEELYDDVVQLAAAICRTPIAIINFVDADRQWGKALIGLDSSEAPRDESFCARTIVAEGGVLIVPDTIVDPAWADNAMVVGAPQLRFYAGASIVDGEGHALGSVCVADREARELTQGQIDALRVLARQTAANLQLRRQTRRLGDADAQLRRMAIEDPLTGLANRTFVFDRLTHALARRSRGGGDVGVLFCDLDAFKPINDRFGHAAGDELLRTVGRRLSDAAGTTDTVARIAGDEFVVVCPDLADTSDLELVVERLTESVCRPAVVDGVEVTPRMSIGSAVASPSDDAERVLGRADEAMYAAKWRRRAAALPGIDVL
jgi:diguanylate cyclase (GGDEF)-like protein